MTTWREVGAPAARPRRTPSKPRQPRWRRGGRGRVGAEVEDGGGVMMMVWVVVVGAVGGGGARPVAQCKDTPGRVCARFFVCSSHATREKRNGRRVQRPALCAFSFRDTAQHTVNPPSHNHALARRRRAAAGGDRRRVRAVRARRRPQAPARPLDRARGGGQAGGDVHEREGLTVRLLEGGEGGGREFYQTAGSYRALLITQPLASTPQHCARDPGPRTPTPSPTPHSQLHLHLWRRHVRV